MFLVLQFAIGDAVRLKHPVDGRVVGEGHITGVPGDTFHTKQIEAPLVRVQVEVVREWDCLLPCPNKAEGHTTLKHVHGLNTLWNARYLFRIRKGLLTGL